MALTATATRKLRLEVCHILGINDPVVVEISPEKPNVFLACGEFNSIMETFGPLVEELQVKRVNMDRVIIFCKKRILCNQIYSFFQYMLRENFAEPPGESRAMPQYRLVDMFTSGSHPDVKEIILKSFKTSAAPLRIVIATIGFGLGIDCSEVRKIIHLGSPSDIESYVQQVGRAGRDGKPSYALLLHGTNLMENSTKSLIDYCKRHDLCRRDTLFSHFEYVKPGLVKGCCCCDVL
jgi:ATP-dependent DNA helicase RecQ